MTWVYIATYSECVAKNGQFWPTWLSKYWLNSRVGHNRNTFIMEKEITSEILCCEEPQEEIKRAMPLDYSLTIISYAKKTKNKTEKYDQSGLMFQV